MEKFYITFYMNSGRKIEIEEEQDPSFDFSFYLKSNEKWFKHGDKIINLNNVDYVHIDTETQKQKRIEEQTDLLSNWN